MLYWLGKFCIFVVTGIDLILMTLVLYVTSFLPRSARGGWYLKLFQTWCWVFIRTLGVKLKLHQKNKKNLPPQFIVIGNHPSAFEDLGMPALFNARFLAKEEMQKWWILGRISIATHTIFVQRESKESRNLAKEELIQTLKEGHNVGLYPEGGCKGRRIFLPFQYGVFDVAIKTGIPIIPVFLHYEAQEDFEWRPNVYLIQKLWEILKSKNKVANYYVFDAIDPKQFADKETLCTYVQELYLRWQMRYLE